MQGDFIPELYMIYTGDDVTLGNEISLSDVYFNGEQQAVEVVVKVILASNKHDIINQYIRFCEYYKAYKKQYNDSSHLSEMIDRCISENVLVQFLSEHRGEIVDTMEMLFSQELAEKVDKEETREEARAEGLAEGRAEGRAEGLEQGEAIGKRKTILTLYRQGNITKDIACTTLNISEDEFERLLEDY